MSLLSIFLPPHCLYFCLWYFSLSNFFSRILPSFSVRDLIFMMSPFYFILSNFNLSNFTLFYFILFNLHLKSSLPSTFFQQIALQALTISTFYLLSANCHSSTDHLSPLPSFSKLSFKL